MTQHGPPPGPGEGQALVGQPHRRGVDARRPAQGLLHQVEHRVGLLGSQAGQATAGAMPSQGQSALWWPPASEGGGHLAGLHQVVVLVRPRSGEHRVV